MRKAMSNAKCKGCQYFVYRYHRWSCSIYPSSNKRIPIGKCLNRIPYRVDAKGNPILYYNPIVRYSRTWLDNDEGGK